MTVRAPSRRSGPRRSGRRPGRTLLVLLVGASLLTGCRIDVATDVGFDRSGGGEVAVSVRIDGATLRLLDAAGVDPQNDVALALGPDPSWRGERAVDADGGLTLTYRQPFSDGEEATRLLRELSDGVAPQDPAVRLDVTVITTSSGAVRMAGTGVIAAPATLGVAIDDVPVGPSADELAALTAEVVRAELVVRVPGRVVEHDADVIDGRTLRWRLQVGEVRTIVLVADAPPLWRRVPLPASVAVAVLTAGGALVLVRARRASRDGDDGRSGADAPEVSPAG